MRRMSNTVDYRSELKLAEHDVNPETWAGGSSTVLMKCACPITTLTSSGLSTGNHIPGKRRRGHMHILPPARDSNVRCPECEQSPLRAPRSPLGVPRTAPHHGGAAAPLVTP